ncbi:MAG: hypothetical protein SVW77_01940 [Candidatus Nanohaloarchaea archaeon]|nr:hypothetical protein [Candidatus Nanohaloarchaea archaeon]
MNEDGVTPNYFGDYDLWVMEDENVIAVKDTGSRFSVYKDVGPVTDNYGLIAEQVDGMLPDHWETEYDDHDFTLASGEPITVPGSERFFGQVTDAERYRLSVRDSVEASAHVPEGSAELRIAHPDLLRHSTVYDATRAVADRLFDLELESDRY